MPIPDMVRVKRVSDATTNESFGYTVPIPSDLYTEDTVTGYTEDAVD